MFKILKLHKSTNDVVYVSIEKVVLMTPVENGTLLNFDVPDIIEENGKISSRLHKLTVSESIEEILEIYQQAQ